MDIPGRPLDRSQNKAIVPTDDHFIAQHYTAES